MDIFSYLLGSLYAGLSPMAGLASTTCTVNGQEVECPAWTGTALFGFWVVYLAFAVFIVASIWLVFKKANQPGWAAIVPIYNSIVTLKIVGKPIWWILLTFIPVVNIIIGVIVAYNLAKVFGKGIGFAIGLMLLPFIFYPILAFGKSTYNPPVLVQAASV